MSTLLPLKIMCELFKLPTTNYLHPLSLSVSVRRRTEREKYERPSRRSMTPVLQPSPDAQQAQPMPRTPTRLRHRVTLTTRAVANLMRAGNTRHTRL